MNSSITRKKFSIIAEIANVGFKPWSIPMTQRIDENIFDEFFRNLKREPLNAHVPVVILDPR